MDLTSVAASDAGTSVTDVAPAVERVADAPPSSSNSSFYTDQLEGAEAETGVDPRNMDSLPDDTLRGEQVRTM